jgi:hypothetical protein
MKKFLLLFFLAFPFAGFADPPSGLIRHDQKADHVAKMFSFGKFQANFNLLNDYVSQRGTSQGFSPFLYSAGFDLVIPVGGRYGEHNASIGAEFIFPQEIYAGDSLKFRMLGWHLLSSFWCYDLLKQDHRYALEIGPGVDWGYLFVKETNGEKNQMYSNGFIAPLVRVEYRVVIKPFAFGVRATYRYDISSPRWENRAEDHSGLAHSRMSGCGFQLFFGYGRIAKDYN